VDACGKILAHPVNERVVGLPPCRLAQVRRSILASGGPEKVPVVRAVLHARYANVLVTDEGTARALCAGVSS
jgi:DNA-binding transcriptional regulator LsrR (DeoR family)